MDSAANPYFLQLFGDFQLTDKEGNRIIGPGKPLAVLAYLALSSRRRAPRRMVGQLLWPEGDEARSQNSLRQALFWIRRRIGVEAVSDESNCLVLGPHIAVDADDLVRAVESRDYRTILTTYRGPLFSGFEVREADEFMDWLAQQCLKFNQRVAAGISAVIENDRFLLADEHLGLTALLVAVAPDDDTSWRLRFQALLARSDFKKIEEEGASLRAARKADDRALNLDLIELIRKARAHEQTVTSQDSRKNTRLPFVGRIHELKVLTSMLEQAMQGESQAVEVVASSGYGKSALLDALAGVAVSAGSTVVAYQASIANRYESYSFIVDLVGRLSQLPGAAGISQESTRLLVDVREGAMPEERNALHADRLASAMVDLLAAVCDEAPLALLLDDVDSMDRASRDVWQGVHRNLPSASVCLVEFVGVSGTFGSGYVTRILLDGVADSDVVRLVEAIVDPAIPERASTTSELAAQLARESQGSPRALARLLAVGLEKGMLLHAVGGWRVASAEAIPLLTRALVSTTHYGILSDAEREVLALFVCSEAVVNESAIAEILGLVPIKVFYALCQLRGLGITSCTDTEMWNVADPGIAAVAAADTARMVRVAARYGEYLSRGEIDARQRKRSLSLLIRGQRLDLVQQLGFDWISALEGEGVPVGAAVALVIPADLDVELKRQIVRQVHRANGRTKYALLVLLAVVVCCLAVLWVWWSRPAQIVRVSQSDPALISYGDMPFEVFPTFEIETRAGKVSRARDGDTAWVRSSVTGAVVRGRPWAVIRDGRMVFDSLYPPAFATGAVMHELNVVVTGLPTLVMQKKFDEAETLRLMRSEINGQVFTESPPRIDVGPSTEIVAKLRWRYSNDASTASYFMGYATSWEAPPRNVHLVRALLVGVNNAEFTDSLRLRSPSTPGHY